MLGRQLGLGERGAFGAAGVMFGAMTYVIWGTQPWALLLVLLAAPAATLGAEIGARIFRVLEHPTQLGASSLVFGLAAAMPIVTGIIDLSVRTHTPLSSNRST